MIILAGLTKVRPAKFFLKYLIQTRGFIFKIIIMKNIVILFTFLFFGLSTHAQSVFYPAFVNAHLKGNKTVEFTWSSVGAHSFEYRCVDISIFKSCSSETSVTLQFPTGGNYVFEVRTCGQSAWSSVGVTIDSGIDISSEIFTFCPQDYGVLVEWNSYGALYFRYRKVGSSSLWEEASVEGTQVFLSHYGEGECLEVEASVDGNSNWSRIGVGCTLH